MFSLGFGPLHLNVIQGKFRGKSSTAADSIKIQSNATNENPDFIN